MSEERFSETTSSGYILEPRTVQDFEHNVQFQMDNLSGYLFIYSYECALVKAGCLLEALQELVKHQNSLTTGNG